MSTSFLPSGGSVERRTRPPAIGDTREPASDGLRARSSCTECQAVSPPGAGLDSWERHHLCPEGRPKYLRITQPKETSCLN